MTQRGTWLKDLAKPGAGACVEGLVAVSGEAWRGGDPAQVTVMETAARYGADYVFFRAPSATQPVVAEALVYVDDGLSDEAFAELHRRLWSWGGVPLVYRKTRGRVDLLRCAHRPDFASSDGPRYTVFSRLDLLTEIDRQVEAAPWWDVSMLREGSLWDDPEVCAELLSADKAAQRWLLQAIADRERELDEERVLPGRLRRRLLVLSLLIAYLEDRGVLGAEVFARCKPGARSFFEVLGDGPGLCALLAELEGWFNGDVFTLSEGDRSTILASRHLGRYAALVEGRTERSGQMSLWRLYSFQDLPVEMISHVYQHFVKNDGRGAVYTPPFLVRLMLAEALSWQRLDRMAERGEAVLDPACGSGVFLVEAYKRLITHWRSRNGWAQPDLDTLRGLLRRVRGVDINADAIELAAFSLCLALCEALDAPTIKASTQLFPKLRGSVLREACFFAEKSEGALGGDVGAVLGNPPFQSKLPTPSARASYEAYVREHGALRDKQIAYLFLHEALDLLQPGGVLCMLQQYNLLYNMGAGAFRQRLFARWDVREVLDFVSIRGLFGEGAADTKVVAVVAEAQPPPPGRKVLHAVFRRTGRVVAQRGFDLDYYDLHWLSRDLPLEDPTVWRCDIFGGGRVNEFVARLRSMRTLGEYAEDRKWDCGEGFIAGGGRVNPNRSTDHVIGKRFLPSAALTAEGIDEAQITVVPEKPIEEPRSEQRFTAPMLLIREHMDLYSQVVPSGYLTYPDQIVGVCAPRSDAARLRQVKAWLDAEIRPLRAYVAATSAKIQKATAVMAADIKALPYPPSGALDLSPNEQIIVDDIVDHYRDFIRLGQKSAMFRRCTDAELASFCEVYARQVSAFYPGLRPLPAQRWPGTLCQPFVFGAGEVDWSGVEGLRSRLARLLEERHQGALLVRRVARIFEGRFIFLLKPDRLRYWLRSAALRDADETLAELRAQGL